MVWGVGKDMEYLVCRMEKGADQGSIKKTAKYSTASPAEDGARGFVGALMCLAGWYLQLHSHIVVREHTARILKFFPPQILKDVTGTINNFWALTISQALF